MSKQNIIAQMREKLAKSLTPSSLEIIDDSHKHIGHVGAQNGGGHFKIVIASETFNHKSLVESHRLIYDALRDLIGKEIHALQINIIKHP